jgi:stearoyl-CoA desaturase (delta-9 desaturase)
VLFRSYHRLFTHKSYKAAPAVSVVLGVVGSMAVQGSILDWVATHRRHHQHTDRPDDPHSPYAFGTSVGGMLRGMVHSHLGWFFAKSPPREVMDKYVPDLLSDPFIPPMSRWFGLWAVLGQLIPAAIGLALTHTWMGALMAWIWGGLLRVFFVHHVTWSVNSVCHLWGSRPFDSHDQSRNNLVMGILAMGEGWHNTHHAFPASARHGLSWLELDVTYWLIRLLAAVGLEAVGGGQVQHVFQAQCERVVARASQIDDFDAVNPAAAVRCTPRRVGHLIEVQHQV